MKKVLIVLSASFCLITGNLVGQVAPQGKSTGETLAQVDLKLISNLLKQLAALLSTTGSKGNSEKMKNITDTTIKVVEILSQVDKIGEDVKQAVTAAKDFPKLVTCTKASKGAREKNAVCQDLGCIRVEGCVYNSLQSIKILLKPLLHDVLIGYEYEGKAQEGLLLQILDLVKQPEVKAKIRPVIDDMRNILLFINELESMIEPSLPKDFKRLDVSAQKGLA